MLQKHENVISMTVLSPQATQQLMPSFSSLPHTQHADGKYRLRRYSVVKYLNPNVAEVGPRTFMQSDQINHFGATWCAASSYRQRRAAERRHGGDVQPVCRK